MINKIIGISVLAFCLIISLLRGLGIMNGDFILPLILLSQLLILGHVVQIMSLMAKDIVIRYNKSEGEIPPPLWHTWN